MLTIIAHMVFWPALVWNVFFWIAAVAQLLNGTSLPRHVQLRNVRDGILSLALLFIPGVYLFGIY